MMDKIKNWLLPVLLALAGSAEMFFGLFAEFVKEAGLPSYYTIVFRMVALLFTVIVTKKQPPSIKHDKKRDGIARHYRSKLQNEKSI